jgi:uncharacterized membrane protein YccF (DUF307 family)
MKFWIYIYFKFVKRSKSKAPKSDAYILFCFLIAAYFLVFFMFLNKFLVDISWVISGQNKAVILFGTIPLLLSPIFIGVYAMYQFNKEIIDLQLEAFEKISPEERKKRDITYQSLIMAPILLCYILYHR